MHEFKTFTTKDALTDNVITWLFEEYSFSPIAKIKNDKYYSIVNDHLGTPYESYDDKGDLVWSRKLNSNGKTIKETGIQNFCPFLYQGQSFDNEIELAYNRFRYYDVEDGRYISQDPIGLAGGFAFYGYVVDVNSFVDVFGWIKVYRLLRDDEDPKKGLKAKKPGRKMSVHGHVSSGSRNKGSQFISTSKSKKALKKWRKDGQKMVSFDTDDVISDSVGNKNIIDISTVEKAKNAGVGSVSANMAASSKEVLIEGSVPSDSITIVK